MSGDDAFLQCVRTSMTCTGVPHVVCIESSTDVLDSSCLAFVSLFYAALANHNSVQYSFNVAAQAARAHDELLRRGGGTVASSSTAQFLLLPEGADHSRVIFSEHPELPLPSVSDASGAPVDGVKIPRKPRGSAPLPGSEGRPAAVEGRDHRRSLPPPSAPSRDAASGATGTGVSTASALPLSSSAPSFSLLDDPLAPPPPTSDELAQVGIALPADLVPRLNADAAAPPPALQRSDRQVSADSSLSSDDAAALAGRQFCYAGQFDDGGPTFDTLLRRLPALAPHFYGRDVALHELLRVRCLGRMERH
jgi:hypothetical protein